MATKEDIQEIEDDENGEFVELPPEDEKDVKKEAKDVKDDASDDKDDTGDDDRLDVESQADAGEDPDEREKIRKARREERKNQREQRKKNWENAQAERRQLREENQELKRRLDGIEGTVSQGQLREVTERYNESIRQVELAERAITKAFEKKDGVSFNEATRIRDEAIAEARQLHGVITRAKNGGGERNQPNPRVLSKVGEWVKRTPWFDPKGTDEDSLIVRAVDRAVKESGFDETSDEYYAELDKRLKKRFPDRYKAKANARDEADEEDDADDEDTGRRERKAPPMGGSRERGPAGNRNRVFVSAERKKALIEAGKWDDPVARARALRYYADHDRNKQVSR